MWQGFFHFKFFFSFSFSKKKEKKKNRSRNKRMPMTKLKPVYLQYPARGFRPWLICAVAMMTNRFGRLIMLLCGTWPEYVHVRSIVNHSFILSTMQRFRSDSKNTRRNVKIQWAGVVIPPVNVAIARPVTSQARSMSVATVHRTVTRMLPLSHFFILFRHVY